MSAPTNPKDTDILTSSSASSPSVQRLLIAPLYLLYSDPDEKKHHKNNYHKMIWLEDGKEHEPGNLAARLQQLTTGRSKKRVVIIVGKSGSGKTHTAWEFYKLFDKDSSPIYLPLAFHCPDDVEDPPTNLYGLVVEIAHDTVSNGVNHIIIVDDILLSCLEGIEAGTRMLELVKQHLADYENDVVILLLQDRAIIGLQDDPGSVLGISIDEITIIEPQRLDNKQGRDASSSIAHQIMIGEIADAVFPYSGGQSLDDIRKEVLPIHDYDFYINVLEHIYGKADTQEVSRLLNDLAHVSRLLLNGKVVKQPFEYLKAQFDRVATNINRRFGYISNNFISYTSQTPPVIFSTLFICLFACVHGLLSEHLKKTKIKWSDLKSMEAELDNSLNGRQKFVRRMLLGAYISSLYDFLINMKEENKLEIDKNANTVGFLVNVFAEVYGSNDPQEGETAYELKSLIIKIIAEAQQKQVQQQSANISIRLGDITDNSGPITIGENITKS